MGKGLQYRQIVAGSTLTFAATFTVDTGAIAPLQVDLTDCLVEIAFYATEADLKAGTPQLHTDSTADGVVRHTNTDTEQTVIVTVPNTVTALWLGRVWYQLRVTTAANQVLLDPSYSDVFEVVAA